MIIPNSKESLKSQPRYFSTRLKKSFRGNSYTTSKDLASSFKYAIKGFQYTFRSQRNFRIHVFIGFLTSIVGAWMKLSFTNIAILVFTISAILILELINTSIEALVDLTIGRRFHPLAQIAKDCSAASVLSGSISSCIIAIVLFLPHLLKHLGA